MSNIESFVTGLSQGINGYLGTQQKTENEMAVQDNASKNSLNNSETLELYKQTLAGKVDPQVASQINPKAAKLVDDFHNTNNRLPSMDEFNSLLTNVDSGQPSDKEVARQDKLEKEYNNKLTGVRGDASLMRTEAQRDAAGLAYDTIAKAQSEGRGLSETEYTDVLGQLWKVRTGASPTEQVLNDLRSKTAKEGLNRVITYASGNPNLVGATTNETLDNVKQFVVSSGNKADQQWQGYMGPRMVPPTGLDPERSAHIGQTHRGISFKDQMNVSDKTYSSKPANDIEAKRAALRDKLGL